MTTNEEVEVQVPGEVNCLGWCNGKFFSPDKKRIRYCNKCRGKKDHVCDTSSKLELNANGIADKKIQEIFQE